MASRESSTRSAPLESVIGSWRWLGRLVCAVSLLGVILRGPVEARAGDDALPTSIAEFAVGSDRMILAQKHIFNLSGWITVGPNVARLGIGPLFAPPYFAWPARATLSLDGKPVEVADYTWYPSETVLDGKPVGDLEIRGRVMPLAGVTAVVCEMSLRNRGTKSVSTRIGLAVEGAVGFSERWSYSHPKGKKKETRRIPISPAKAGQAIIEKPDCVLLRSRDDRAELAVALAGAEASPSDDSLGMRITLRPGQEQIFRAVVVLNSPEKTPGLLAKVFSAPERFMADTRQDWQRRIGQLDAAAPVIETPHRELAAFYRRSLFTFLSCRWDSDAFLFRPWYATSGMDGGAMCSYLWDLSYTSKMAVLCDAVAVRRYLLAFVHADLTSSHSVNPLDGSPSGAMYSYNYYNLVRLAYDYVSITGDLSVLSEKIRDETFLDYLYRYALGAEDLGRSPELIDYGTNRNLLELKRTEDYQHYTPSPNGERILIYRRLNELHAWAGRKTPDDLAKRAEALREVFLEKLWDSEHGWFHCLDGQQQPRIAYSIQIFDLLRTGMLSREQQDAVTAHLNDREFLSSHGVHSLSKQDEGYDVNDADWGGPGVYVGDAPELVVDLIDAGYEKQGINIFKRILWWREFPYIPQAVLADSRDYRRNGRANVIAGLSGGQAILNGLLGIRVDGQRIRFRPVKDSLVAGLRLSNLKIRGQEFSLEVDSRAENYSVSTGDVVKRGRTGESIEIPLRKL